MVRTKFFAEEDARTLLRNWVKMNTELMALPYDAVKELLVFAVEEKRGTQQVERIYMRYNKLRRAIELKGLKKGTLPWNNQQS